jgi:antitoxin (DNA-binding transcriptional repressor) of toxin-antitoxin stability system
VYTQIRNCKDIHMETTKVGIREFRSDLAEYIASNAPVAVTRHGQTVGFFIPTHGQVEADIAALKNASKTLDKLLAAQDVDVDSVVADSKAARRKASTTSKKIKTKAV